MNPSETVIVIRSLVPGGVAQTDGRLLPGDRLLFVNDRNLENASLEAAVAALKGAPRGIVVVGVAKPLPLFLSGGRRPKSPQDDPILGSCGYGEDEEDCALPESTTLQLAASQVSHLRDGGSGHPMAAGLSLDYTYKHS